MVSKDIGDFIEQDSATVTAIYNAYKKKGDKTAWLPRNIWAGSIGHKCERFLWYRFRHCIKTSFPGRMYRLFDSGNSQEARLAEDLRSIGMEVHEIDNNTGKQFRVDALGGHLTGRLDGAGLGVLEAPKTWHVLEFKTSNRKNFTALKKSGVEKQFPEHFAQMQIYMHLTGMKRALYLCVNKDTDELYSERIRYDAKFCKSLIEKARRVIASPDPPERISGRSDYYECRFCDAHAICHRVSPDGSELPMLPVQALSCRQCCYATAEIDGPHAGGWTCGAETGEYVHRLCNEEQAKACPKYLANPGILGLDPDLHGVDGEGHQYIQFVLKNGATIRHGGGKGMWKGSELMVTPESVVGNPTIQAAKAEFSATAKGIAAGDAWEASE